MHAIATTRYGNRRCHDHGVVARQRVGRRVLVTWRALFAEGWGEVAESGRTNSPPPPQPRRPPRSSCLRRSSLFFCLRRTMALACEPLCQFTER